MGLPEQSEHSSDSDLLDPLARFLRAERPGRLHDRNLAPAPVDIPHSELLQENLRHNREIQELVLRMEAMVERARGILERRQQNESKSSGIAESDQNDIAPSQQNESELSDICPPSDKILLGGGEPAEPKYQEVENRMKAMASRGGGVLLL